MKTSVLYFFFQAEDGIRHPVVTGVQTCALPISRSEPNKTKKNCFLTFHMSGWCQTLLLDSQKSLLFLCKREVLSRRECFRTLIYLEMTQLFSTLSSLSLAQDRNSGNQNTWRNDCMFSSVQWLSRV